MKNVFRISGVIIFTLATLLFNCKNENLPTVTTAAVTNITGTTATSGGTIVFKRSGKIISKGVCWSTGISPTVADTKTIDGGGFGNFLSDITGLNEATVYYVRAYATNSAGTGYGTAMSFTTLGKPAPTISEATNIGTTGAILNGMVNANYLTTEVTFEYGTTTNYGITISAIPSPLDGNTNTSVSANITELEASTTYHFRIVSTNLLGKTLSNDMTFITLTPVVDIEGNIYNIRTIGTQVWMTENLKTTKYSNGDLIGTTTPTELDITNEISPKYQWAYDISMSYANIYGRLYTWYAVNDSRNICPIGWHVPTDAEWTTLENYLIANGYSYDGTTTENKIAKALASTTLWASDTGTGTVGNTDYPAKRNATGFTTLPGGSRSSYGACFEVGSYGFWWSSSESSDITTLAWYRYMRFDNSNVLRYSYDKRLGYSVRCLKDN